MDFFLKNMTNGLSSLVSPDREKVPESSNNVINTQNEPKKYVYQEDVFIFANDKLVNVGNKIINLTVQRWQFFSCQNIKKKLPKTACAKKHQRRPRKTQSDKKRVRDHNYHRILKEKYSKKDIVKICWAQNLNYIKCFKNGF